MIALHEDDDAGSSQTVDVDVEMTLREVKAFLDDPVALMERALTLLREQSIHVVSGFVAILALWPDWAT